MSHDEFNLPDISARIPAAEAGAWMHALARELFPMHRATTGDGVRNTLRLLRNHIPLEIHEVPSGMRVFDWEVPGEWTIRDAYVANLDGERVIDYTRSNLHVISGSQPMYGRFRWSELKPHLHTLPDRPYWIPYRTAFFHEEWGFCLSQQQFDALDAQGDVEYDVCIDADYKAGSLTYGEVYLRGARREEVLISAHVCHPSLANDNLSGIVLATWLARELSQLPRQYSYRFVFAPATIGAITWLALNRNAVELVRHGLVLSVVGDAGPLTYKKSRRGNAEIDRAVEHVLGHTGRGRVREFEPLGYDERQFCSPGFDLPVGCLMRTPHGEYPQYHTSADDLTFLCADALADSLARAREILYVLEHNRTYRNTHPHCEPPLGKYGLYEAYGHSNRREQLQRATQWVLNFSDGFHSLLDIAERSQMPFAAIHAASERLAQCGLLEEISTTSEPPFPWFVGPGTAFPTELPVGP